MIARSSIVGVSHAQCSVTGVGILTGVQLGLQDFRFIIMFAHRCHVYVMPFDHGDNAPPPQY
ncbi:hypothetical protein DPMN_031809 [Dreissena polymorpha]|uniref:Uncharacterized protein n=1 Tax=Dreissena polymorpha TaxID=45954 RepID=A0A9D4M1Q8_DREPO|nr:hypothetical protein DPMN_031809 [Dreissena polymorpha]